LLVSKETASKKWLLTSAVGALASSGSVVFAAIVFFVIVRVATDRACSTCSLTNGCRPTGARVTVVVLTRREISRNFFNNRLLTVSTTANETCIVVIGITATAVYIGFFHIAAIWTGIPIALDPVAPTIAGVVV
jgi:hypothetical protein